MPQLQHNMWVVAARSAVLSVITGGGKWVEITTHADPLYQHLIVTAERKFWRCVENGDPPRLFGVEPPRECFAKPQPLQPPHRRRSQAQAPGTDLGDIHLAIPRSGQVSTRIHCEARPRHRVLWVMSSRIKSQVGRLAPGTWNALLGHENCLLDWR